MAKRVANKLAKLESDAEWAMAERHMPACLAAGLTAADVMRAARAYRRACREAPLARLPDGRLDLRTRLTVAARLLGLDPEELLAEARAVCRERGEQDRFVL